jgi:1,2-diacylglycerol 3-alpha-glucosyltransferase
VPCIATYHTLFEEYLFHYLWFAPRRLMRALARRFSRSQCNQLDAVIVPSSAMREVLGRYGVTTRTEIVPTGIPLPDFAGGDGARFRTRHDIAMARPLLLFVGRVAFEKNIEFLLRMLLHVRRVVPGVLLVVCGEGPAERHLRALTKTLDLGEHVRFVGYLDRNTQLLDCYRAADAFVFASRTETQGLVLLEAMALGVPVVSTSVMGTRDVVGAGRGVLVAEDDEGRFADAVVRLLSDTRLRAQLAEDARRYAETWSAPEMARRLVSVYDSVIAAAARSKVGRNALTAGAPAPSGEAHAGPLHAPTAAARPARSGLRPHSGDSP